MEKSRTRVKICGMTRDQDVDAAVDAGADALGFICYPKSPRHVSTEQFARLADRARPFVTVVAVVVDPGADYLQELVDHVDLDAVQFHGQESPEFCARWGKPWIKASRVRAGVDLESTLTQPYKQARGWLVDAYHARAVGGTGETFDWQLLKDIDPQRLVLAGGLHSDNIATAISQVQPFAVDISTGVEVSPGIKDASRIKAFMTEVQQADNR